MRKLARRVESRSQKDVVFADWLRHFSPGRVSVLRRLDRREADAAHGTGATP